MSTDEKGPGSKRSGRIDRLIEKDEKEREEEGGNVYKWL